MTLPISGGCACGAPFASGSVVMSAHPQSLVLPEASARGDA